MLRAPSTCGCQSVKRKFNIPALFLAAWLLILGLPHSAAAAEQDAGFWAIFSSTDHFESADDASRWRYWFDAQVRFFDPGSGANQYLVRPGIGYDLNDNVTVWAGYARFRTQNTAGAYADEDRFWQQLTWTAAHWDQSSLSMRVRLEERSVSIGDDLGWVLRYMVKYAQPIGDSGNRTFFASLEPFFLLRETDWGGSSGLRQNRLSIGVTWKLSDRTSLDTGYMNQYSWADAGEDRMYHHGVVNLKMKF